MIKKILIVSASMAVVACGGSDSSNVIINDVTPDAGQVEASSIAFNPADGVLPLPSDILYAGTTDGTLEPPGESAAKAAGEATDLSDPASALGGVDGWSTQMPMQISIDLADGATIDETTVGPETVLLIETNCSFGLMNCSSFTTLSYGFSGYVASVSGNSIVVVPTVPLTPKTTYLVALTNGIQDSRGMAITQSPFYEQVTVDPADVDIENETLGTLQDVINGYEALIQAGTGTSPEDLIFSSSWTTGSAGDAVLGAVSAYYNPLAPAYTPVISEIASHPETPVVGAVDVYQGSVTLPYFLASSTADDPGASLTQRFTALCDNGLLLSQADPAVLAALPAGPNAATCSALGLGDFIGPDGQPLDSERYVTRFNPVAAVQSNPALDVIVTVPNALSGQVGPFPVVIYQHGITANKETVLAFANELAVEGYAAIAIDLPLHGSRGFDLNGDGTDEINASVDVTNFLNLGYLLTGKDNLRQSVLDLLGLRMAMNSPFAFADGSAISDADFDRSTIKFVGMSLGGMVGTEFVALSAASGMPLDSAALVVPGGGIAALLLSSGSFGPLIQGTVLGAAGVDPDADPETAATVLGQFAFAAQTIVESGDPNNFAGALSGLSTAGVTPLYLAQVNGDATIPNQSSFGGLTFGGTEPLARLFELEQRSFGDDAAANGFVKFTEGSHGTFLSAEASAAATEEMQAQVATFIGTGDVIVTDAGVVE